MSTNRFDYLDQLEAEAIHILREAGAQFEKPALLFSGGKDSLVLVHLARKAFSPGHLPFPLVHIDTGHNFSEVLNFRDKLALREDTRIIVRSVEATIQKRQLSEATGKLPSRNALQTYTLLDTIAEFGFDACLVGRLLFDSKNILEDQLEALERQSRYANEGVPDLALLTD